MSQLNNLFFQILDNFPNGFIFFDENADILYINPALSNNLGYEKNNIIKQKKIWELDYYVNSADLFNEKINNLIKSKKTNSFSVYKKNDGTFYKCQKINFSIENDKNNTNYFFSIVCDEKDTFFNHDVSTDLNEKLDKLKIPLFTIITSISAFKLKDELDIPFEHKDIELNVNAIEKSANKLNYLIEKLKS